MYFSYKEKVLRILYNILTYLVEFHLKIIAIFNTKIKLGVQGRANTIKILKANIALGDKVIWFHCASLGEYEQGLPVFQEIKSDYPDHKIVLSFFSPSGYEIRKNNPITKVVVYLPFDTKFNAKTFLNLIHPDLVVFVKYEIWPNYLNELYRRKIKTVLISALFRNEQIYFKFYGKWMRKSLRAFHYFFVQNHSSKELLESMGYRNVSVSGDTRFDRVYNQLNIDNTLDIVENFKQDKLCVVAGSTWPEDEKLLLNYINSNSYEVKFIIAPHNIKTGQIESLRAGIKKETLLYSSKDQANIFNSQVLIIDSIGILSKIYAYADVAYIGGAYGNTGLHNTLEAAVFGVPIIIGKNYKRFPEAYEMIANGGMYSISNQEEFDSILNSLLSNTVETIQSGIANSDYIKKNRGAVIQIMTYIRI